MKHRFSDGGVPHKTADNLDCESLVAGTGNSPGMIEERRRLFVFSHVIRRIKPLSVGMAATVTEGTARKLVTRKCGRTMTNSEDRGDSRRDGTESNYQRTTNRR